VTPKAEGYLSKARGDLDDARKIADIHLGKVAARSAYYYAALHAAEALIIEHTGKVVKTHSGVRSELARLLKNAPADRALATFLAQAYKYKEIGDYGVGARATVTDEEAREAIAGAARFIDRIAILLMPTGPTKS
jgi:uncharacterized protein (UPF0332 family)